MSDPWLSVIIPTYNGIDYVESALGSVVSQAGEGVEIVVVDDGSTDGTAERVRGYRDRHGVTLVVRPHGGNWLATTNHGLSLARGDFACVLHQDDVWAPGRIARLREGLRAHPRTAFLIHPSRFIDDRGRHLGLWRCPLRGPSPDPVVLLRRLLIQNFVAVPAAVFRRDLVLGLGAFDEALWYTADWDLWLKLAAHGPTTFLPEPLTAFRVHRCSQTWLFCEDEDEFRRQMELVRDRHLPLWEAGRRVDHGLRRVSRFSIEVNVRLAALSHGRSAGLIGLAASFLSLGPLGWHDYLTNSRVAERALARLKVAVARR